MLRTLAPEEREVGDARGRWYIARIQPYRTLEERIAGVVMTFTDITRQRRAEQSLLESRAVLEKRVRLFDAMLGALPEWVCTVDGQGRLVYANPAVLRLLGRSVEEIAGRTFEEAGFERGLAARLERRVAQVIASGQAVRDPEGGRGERARLFAGAGCRRPGRGRGVLVAWRHRAGQPEMS